MPRYKRVLLTMSQVFNTEGEAYSGSVGNDLLDIVLRVDLGRRVRAGSREFGKARDYQREGLGIDDMPVEGVQLKVSQDGALIL